MLKSRSSIQVDSAVLWNLIDDLVKDPREADSAPGILCVCSQTQGDPQPVLRESLADIKADLQD